MLSFLFVLSTVHEDVWKVLKQYSSSVVEVIPWALPGHLPNDPETRSQFLHAETWQRRRLEVRYHSRFFMQAGHETTYPARAKGQLISKGLFDVIVSTKKKRFFLKDFCPSL